MKPIAYAPLDEAWMPYCIAEVSFRDRCPLQILDEDIGVEHFKLHLIRMRIFDMIAVRRENSLSASTEVHRMASAPRTTYTAVGRAVCWSWQEISRRLLKVAFLSRSLEFLWKLLWSSGSRPLALYLRRQSPGIANNKKLVMTLTPRSPGFLKLFLLLHPLPTTDGTHGLHLSQS